MYESKRLASVLRFSEREISRLCWTFGGEGFLPYEICISGPTLLRPSRSVTPFVLVSFISFFSKHKIVMQVAREFTVPFN